MGADSVSWADKEQRLVVIQVVVLATTTFELRRGEELEVVPPDVQLFQSF